MEDSGEQGAGEVSAAQRIKPSNAQDAERLVIYCQTTSPSAAHALRIALPTYPVSAAITGFFRMASIATSEDAQVCPRPQLLLPPPPGHWFM